MTTSRLVQEAQNYVCICISTSMTVPVLTLLRVAKLPPQHAKALLLYLVGEMVLGALPDRLENIRLGQEELDIVVGPRVCRQALEEDDHFLFVVSKALSPAEIGICSLGSPSRVGGPST